MSTPNLSGDFAVSLWFKANSFNSDVNELITNPNNGTGGFGISIGGSGTNLDINSPNEFSQILCSYSFSTGTWYHIVISRNNGAFAAWINGANQNVTYQSTYDFSGPIALGWDNNNPSFAFDGTIDEVGIWTKFLTSQNVATLYSNGIGIQYPFTAPPSTLLNGIQAYWKLDDNGSGGLSLNDSTTNGYNLTDSNNATLGIGKINGDASFNGNNRLYSSTFGVDVNADFSVSFWIKAVNTNLNTGQHILGAPFQNGLYIGGAYNNGLQLKLYNGSGAFGVDTSPLSLDTWYHATLVRSGDTLSGYLDGTYLGQSDISGQSFGNSSIISIGGGEYNQYYFEGEIDEVGIWDRALTPTEITDLYNTGTGLSYPFGGEPPTPVLGLKDGIQAYWKLDDSTWSDSSINGYTLTNNGGVTNGTGIVSGDAVFNGTNFLKNDTFPTIANNPFSVSFWNKEPSGNPYGLIGPQQWGIATGFGGNYSWGIYRDNSFGGINLLWSQNGSGLDNRMLTNLAFNDGDWHHYVIVYNGTDAILYVDGTNRYQSAVGFVPYTSTSIPLIMGLSNGIGTSEQFDEVGIWNRVLSPSEITTLYNDGLALSYPFIPTSGLSLWLDASDSNTVLKSTPSPVPLIEYTADDKTSLLMHFDGSNGSTTFTDSSINNRTFTASDGAIVSTTNSKFGGASLQMNSGYLTAPSDASLGFDGDFTIECWIYLNNNNIGYQWFVSTVENNQDYTGWIIYTEGNSLLSFLAHNPNSYGWSFGLQGPQPPANEWFHYAIVRSGSTLKMFVNGIDVNASSYYGSDFSQPVAYGNTICIGNYLGNASIPLDGFIDEVRVSKGIARFPSTFVNPAANGDSVVSWLDKSGNDNHATQSNSSLQPVLSANTINGKSAVRFDGSTQYLTDTVAGVDGSHTVFVVANRRGAASGDGFEVPLSYGGILVDDGFPFAFKSNSTFASYPMYYKFGQSGYIDNVSSYSNDTTYIASLPINTQTLTWPFVVNGVSLGTATATSYTSNGNNQIIIGAQPNVNGRYFNGDVAEVLIYNRVLSNTEKYDVETYLNQKYNAYTVPSIVEDGLVLWLDAGDSRSYPGTGSTWYDLSPSNNNGTLNGGSTYNAVSGGAINFNGSTGYVNFGSYTPANESFTLEIALTWNDYDTANVQFLFSGNYEKLEIHTGGDIGTNGIRFIPAGNGGSPYFLDETNIIDANVNHITVVWNADSSIASIYKNGAFVTSSILYGASIKTLQDLSIGKRADNTYYFSGNIYITRLYDRVLDATEIAKNYNTSCARFGLSPYTPPPSIITNGLVLHYDLSNPTSYSGSGSTVTDISYNGNDGTLVNSPVFSSTNGGELTLNGTDSYIDCGNNANLQFSSSFTLSIWVKIASSSIGVLISHGNNAYVVYFGDVAGQAQLAWAKATVQNDGGGPLIDYGQWYNITAVNDLGTNVKYYVNGVLTQTNPFTPTYTYPNNLRIGSTDSEGYFMNGTVGAVAIYNRILSGSEILQNFDITKTRFGL